MIKKCAAAVIAGLLFLGPAPTAAAKEPKMRSDRSNVSTSQSPESTVSKRPSDKVATHSPNRPIDPRIVQGQAQRERAIAFLNELRDAIGCR
ncbi:Uncharacterised protein [Mycolicibacterium thermoresistibile]|nr:Uncharacterised protein [Mycolicibacterium thermoresistibile]